MGLGAGEVVLGGQHERLDDHLVPRPGVLERERLGGERPGSGSARGEWVPRRELAAADA